MSGIYILKNVYNFAQILNLASSEHLRKWDESTLKKALNWAQYCEEVYNHLVHQSYAKDVNYKIIEMAARMTPPSFLTLTLNFNCLGTARKLIIETILTNSAGSPNLKKCLEALVEPTLWSEIRNQEQLQIMKDQEPSIHAKILLKNILTVLKASSENEERIQQYLAFLCDRLVTLERGWDLLVQFFVINPENKCIPSELESMREPMFSVLLSWMNLKMKDISKCPILEQDLDILKQASLNNVGFFSLYLSSLEKWGNCFQPCIDGSGNELWRDNNNSGASHLSCHFHHLLLNSLPCDTGKVLKPQVLGVLTRNIKQSDFTVWRTVANSLLSGS